MIFRFTFTLTFKLKLIRAMCKILRWTGYVSTLIGAIFIIMSIIGGFRYHHHYIQAHAQTFCNMQHAGGNMAVVVSDSVRCKQHSVTVTGTRGKQDSVKYAITVTGTMGKQDSGRCCKKQPVYLTTAPMICHGCRMYHHRIGFHMGLAMCFLLLAIALFMISNSCCRNKNRENNEEKKE